MTENALERLEKLVARAAELLVKVQAENTELKSMVYKLQDDLEELRRENSAKGEIIEQLKNDRLEIRSRVNRIMNRIAALEKPVRESRS